MRAFETILLGACAVFAGCGSSRPGRAHGFGACKPVVQGREILCGSSHVAAVECYGRVEDSCRALAIRYHDGNVAWLYQAPWFNPDRPDSALERQSPYDWASNVEMTPDALFLWYRTDDENGTRWMEYDVQAGMQRPVERFRIVQLRDVQYRGGVVQIPLFDPARDSDAASQKPNSG